jgi:hypothetical protein
MSRDLARSSCYCREVSISKYSMSQKPLRHVPRLSLQPTVKCTYLFLCLTDTEPPIRVVSTTLPYFFLKYNSTYPSTNKFAPFTKLILGLVMSTATSPTSSNFALLPCRASSAFQASIGTPPSVPTIGVSRLVSRKPGEIAFTRMWCSRTSRAAFVWSMMITGKRKRVKYSLGDSHDSVLGCCVCYRSSNGHLRVQRRAVHNCSSLRDSSFLTLRGISHSALLHKHKNGNSHFDAILLHHLDDLVFGAEKDTSTVDSHPFLKAFESSLVGCC